MKTDRNLFKFSLLAVAVLLVALLGCTAVVFAGDAPVMAPGEFHINPLYKDVFSEDSLPSEGLGHVQRTLLSPGDPEEFNNAADAAAYLKQQMKARNTSVTMKVNLNYSSEIINDIFNAALEHDPEDPTGGDYIRWQYGNWSVPPFSYTSGSFTFTYNISYYDDADQEAALTTALNAVMDSLELEGKSDIAKLRLIYEYIVGHVTYDYTNLNDDSYMLKYTAYAALIDGTSVCQGYANLLYRMLLTAGIDTRVIAGLGNGGDHAWNIVKLGDKYYDVDVTWDSGNENYSFYLRCDANFGDHVRSGIVNPGDIAYNSSEFYTLYPMSGTDYGYTLSEGVLTISGDLGKVYDSFVANRLAGHENEITSVIIGSGIESLGEYAFLNCPSIQSVTMTKSVESIGRMCFSGASALETVTSMEGVKDIDYAAFNGCAVLKNLVLPAVESIGEQAFYQCASLENAVIGGTVSNLPGYSFAACSALKSLTLPAAVGTVGFAAFNGCSILEDVYFAGTQEQWDTLVSDAEDQYNFAFDFAHQYVGINHPVVHVAPVANGTLGGRVGWWFDDSDKITFTGADFLGTGEAVMTATYSADGRMTGLQLLNPTTPTQTVADGYGSVKMMLLGSGLAPAAEAAGFEAP